MTEDTPICAFVQGDAPFVTTVKHQAECDEGIAEMMPQIMEAMSKGEPFTEGGGASPAFTFISLRHRDAPIHAAKVLTLAQMSDLLAAFCSAHSLPFQSADELLAKVSEVELPSQNIINWLSAYIDGWFSIEDMPPQAETHAAAEDRRRTATEVAQAILDGEKRNPNACAARALLNIMPVYGDGNLKEAMRDALIDMLHLCDVAEYDFSEIQGDATRLYINEISAHHRIARHPWLRDAIKLDLE